MFRISSIPRHSQGWLLEVKGWYLVFVSDSHFCYCIRDTPSGTAM